MTTSQIQTRIDNMNRRELADVAEGRVRIGDTQAEQLTAWNMAIDAENGY